MNLFTIAAPESHAVLPKLGQKAEEGWHRAIPLMVAYSSDSAAVRVPALIVAAARMLTSA
jgi:hypothetical protein